MSNIEILSSGEFDKKITGGKFNGLCESSKLGFNIPKTCVVTTKALNAHIIECEFSDDIKNIIRDLQNDNLSAAKIKSSLLREKILSSKINKSLVESINKNIKKMSCENIAIRSSATVEDGTAKSWAGQFESYLNVSPKDIPNKILACWASLYSDRAIDYSYRNGYVILQPEMAVIIQEMIPASVAGVIFTANPLSMNNDELFIEYCYGNGEKLVSGEITPHTFKVKKYKMRGAKKLSSLIGVKKNTLIDFLKKIIKSETVSGLPRDIEWAIYNNKIWLLQNRSVTTIKKNVSKTIEFKNELWMLHLSRNMSVFHNSLMIEGHFYYSRLFEIDYPPRFLSITTDNTKTKLYVEKESLKLYEKDIQEKITDQISFDKIISTYKDKILNLKSISNEIKNNYSHNIFDEFCEAYRQLAGGLSLTIIGGQQIESLLIKNLSKKYSLTNERARLIAGELSRPDKETPYQKAINALKCIIQKNTTHDKEKTDSMLEIWLLQYRHISVNFCETPMTLDYVYDMAKAFAVRDKPQEKHLEQHAPPQPWENDATTIDLAGRLKILTSLNEDRKEAYCIASLALQSLLKYIAKKENSPSWKNLYNLTYTQLTELITNDSRSSIVQQDIALWIDGQLKTSPLNQLNFINIARKKTKYKSNYVIKGFPVSGGTVQSTIRIVTDQNDFSKVKNGDIIVAHMTSVDFCPLFEKAAGIITEEGGMTSHAAVVAREYLIPCVVGVLNAMTIFKDGQLISLCGNSGEIYIV
ncbi:PEP/pyruvate-binding domain-containing protein [Brenneria goodwinii]|uniref:PEP/pyruvate-binding domain-containing protein n=1 Tax=Brenneria goodwinii TaxID=1109412 RepID=UPI0036EABF75